jgi:hypothetical protein
MPVNVNLDKSILVTLDNLYQGKHYDIAFEKYEDAQATSPSSYGGTWTGGIYRSGTATVLIRALTEGDGLIVTSNSVSIDPNVIKDLSSKTYYVRLLLDGNIFYKITLRIKP